MLQSMEPQRVRHILVTEQQQQPPGKGVVSPGSGSVFFPSFSISQCVPASWRLQTPLPPFLSGEGNGNLLQHSCLENPTDRGAWHAMVWGHKELGMTEQLNTSI